jgi:hypothetical protein
MGVNSIAMGEKYRGTVILGLASGTITADGITENVTLALEQLVIRDYNGYTPITDGTVQSAHRWDTFLDNDINQTTGIRRKYNTTYKIAKEGLNQSDFSYLYESPGVCNNPNWNKKNYSDILGWTCGTVADPGEGYARYTAPKYCSGKITHNEREYTGFIAAGTSLGYIAYYLGSEAGWMFRAAPDNSLRLPFVEGTGKDYDYNGNYGPVYNSSPCIKYVTAPIYVNGSYYIVVTYTESANWYIITTAYTFVSTDLLNWNKINITDMMATSFSGYGYVDYGSIFTQIEYINGVFYAFADRRYMQSFDGRVWTSASAEYNRGNYLAANSHGIVYSQGYSGTYVSAKF